MWERHPLISFVAAFVAWDAAGYVYHLIGHRTQVGWAAHRPHHTGTEFNLSLGLRLSWMPWHGLLIYPWLSLAGWSLTTVAVCAVISNTWQALEHSSAPLRFPAWLRAVAMTPEAHRHHHALDAGAVNLGPVLTVWDRVLGTWRAGSVDPGTLYGLDERTSSNPLRVELDGWMTLRRAAERGRAPGVPSP